MGSEILIDGISEPTENWFKFPTEVIEYLPDMTEKEIKAFIYIVRHTWGFHDNEKKITLDEFVNGRKRKDGSRMDNGCGLSKPSVVAALALLKHKGFINTRTNGDKAREKVYYSLRLKILTPKIEQELKILTPDDQNRGKKSLPRSEKDTLNTKEEKDTSYEDTDVSSIADATASVAAADFEPEIELPFEFGVAETMRFMTAERYEQTGGGHWNNNTNFHIVVKEDIQFGRLKRKAGDILCRAKKPKGLVQREDIQPGCKKCLEYAEKIANPAPPPVHSQIIGIIASELARNDGNDFETLSKGAQKGITGHASAIWANDLKEIHELEPIDPDDFRAFCEARRARNWGFPSTKKTLGGFYGQWLSNNHSIPETQKKSQPPRQSQYGQHKGVYPPGVKIDIPEVRPTTHLTTDPETGKVRKEIFDGFITRRDGSRHPA